MDIAPIITSTVALLVPYLAKVGDGMLQKAGEDAWDKMKKLYQTPFTTSSVWTKTTMLSRLSNA
ncbi:hypothetical protein [Iningainema tapete]|uniref:Uncharacterized protein n=1 Tax=Iningainema tapete BLCC-T55 TaxID=2748662 RepID=A0A8J6XNS8_9CYAN|nr:hypothetical protein [Iningainema tapete]MBD2773842.1 hypothetical protein [Iningainema tapete BLCC-T55]